MVGKTFTHKPKRYKTAAQKFLGSRRGHFSNGHLPGYGGRFPEVPTADHGESRESHQTGGETGQGGVSGGAGKR